MTRKLPYLLVFDQEVKGHLATIDAKYHTLIVATIDEQLSFEPETETRNRKPLQPPAAFGATWELRFGPDNRFRVFYSVDQERREVQILAVGVKVRNRLVVGGKSIEL